MKKAALLLFVLVYSQLYSQSYIPVLQEGNKWSVDVYYGLIPPCDPTPCEYTVTPQISLGDIETIGDLDYVRVISDGANTCLLREDGGLVYRYDEVNKIEKVLFDFTLELGDVFEVEGSAYDCCEVCVNQVYGLSGGDLTVIEVEFLELAGELRKVITFDAIGWGGNFQWIEGIGNISGFDFMWEQIDITDGSLLVCFETEGISYFFNGATSCDNSTLGFNDLQHTQFVLYPNPSNSEIYIKSEEGNPVIKVELYNLLGEKVNTVNNGVESIDVSHLVSGIYLLKIFSTGGTTLKKIIKN